MDNLTATRSLCNAICNTFYPDMNTIKMVLFNDGVDESADAKAKDPAIFRAAVKLVKGYVEGSRSENGVSTSVLSEDAIKESLAYWCNIYGLDADEELGDSLSYIEDGSHLW